MKFILFSFLSGLLGIVVGSVAASLYQNIVHPNDPDPVDFIISGIFGGTAIIVWLAGTILSYVMCRAQLRQQKPIEA